ncbi:hypothetical protein DFH11DRAFT_1818279 [Phellopilus nigrolimitatus]|nr:hypothetical protein DFH11DRAFT_1818279 [Phellopilus nigrolimitatus]
MVTLPPLALRQRQWQGTKPLGYLFGTTIVTRATTQDEDKKEDSQLLKSVKDSTKRAAEAQHGLIVQVLKDVLFSSRTD